MTEPDSKPTADEIMKRIWNDELKAQLAAPMFHPFLGPPTRRVRFRRIRWLHTRLSETLDVLLHGKHYEY